MKRLSYICILLIFVASVYAQDRDVDELVVRSVADYVLEHAAFTYTNVLTGKEYKTAGEIPADAEVRFTSPFSEWHYTNGVLNMSMVNLANFLNDKKYSDFAAKHVANGMDNYKFFQKRFKNDRPHYQYPYGQLWTMSELDDYGAIGASMMDVYKINKRDDFKKYLEDAAKHITTGQERLSDGTLVRTFPHEMTLWADDLYMSVPFLVRMADFSGDQKYLDDAMLQVTNFTKYLWNEDKELYYHCYYSDLDRNGVAHWGRCNGWVMMAKVHLLNFLPEDHPRRQEMIDNLETQILGIAMYQNGDGLWHQVLDKTDSYTESSCTAMFTYCIARAVNQGWIDERYASIAVNGWDGLKREKIQHDGQIKDICIGTGIEDNMVFYYNRPARLNEKHGIGAVIDAGIEVIRLKKKS